MSDDERTPVGYMDSAWSEGQPAERVVLHAREGSKVYVRAIDPCEPEPERVPLYEGDQVVRMEHLSHISHHLTLEGDDTYLLAQRIVLVSREPDKVVARTLRYGEPDDGRRVHVVPGERVEVHPTIELESIDEFESRGVTGYVPITPVLFTWMAIAPQPSDDKPQYLLAAARRLDQAQSLFQRVEELRQSDPEGAPAQRRAIFELVGACELAVVSLSRAMDMCMKAGTDIGATTAVPTAITSHSDAITAIRNAYEHIEDRALGNVWGKPHADALTIFDHVSVAMDGVITYGKHQLDLATDVPQIISAARGFLKAAAGGALTPPAVQPITVTPPTTT